MLHSDRRPVDLQKTIQCHEREKLAAVITVFNVSLAHPFFLQIPLNSLGLLSVSFQMEASLSQRNERVSCEFGSFVVLDTEFTVSSAGMPLFEVRASVPSCTLRFSNGVC